jgi:hypothetical protein
METRVIGLLCWYDESPTWLGSCIASMARVCDHLVAVDGRYRDYPSRETRSTLAQYEAITDAALSAGMGLTIHSQTEPWETEMEKRSAVFAAGALSARVGTDWFFILDADERLIDAPDKDAALALLDEIRSGGNAVAMAEMGESVDPHLNDMRTDAGTKLFVPWRYTDDSPRFWLALENMRVGKNHFDYIGDIDGQPVNLWGMNAPRDTLWFDATEFFQIENLNRHRSQKRDADRQRYYETRDAMQIEDVTE